VTAPRHDGRYQRLQAFEDAIRFRRARAAGPCPACDTAPGGRCEDHARDLDLITGYQQAVARADSDPPQHPSVYACHGARWSIDQHPGGWTAHRIGLNGPGRFASAATEAGLITALHAAEAEPDAPRDGYRPPPKLPPPRSMRGRPPV